MEKTTNEEPKRNRWRMLSIIGGIVLIGLLVAGWFGWDTYQSYFGKNVPDNLASPYVHIPSFSTFEDVVDILEKENFIINKKTFESVAGRMNYIKNPMRAGRFKIKSGMSNHELIGHLRSGEQAAVKVVLHNKRRMEDVAGYLAGVLESDSSDIMDVFINPVFLQQFELKPETAMTAIIPNTYELYWNTHPQKFYERMIKEHKKFWNEDRLAKAKALDMAPSEVYTLASIVETETQQNSEKDRIAGVYLNRLEKGWKLEADPTVVFAWQDFSLRRVLKKHLEIDSPYNTYRNEGLPPGPIYMASIASIDKTLNHEDHDYMFFCARPDNSGLHAFAKTNAGHSKNAQRYHRWLKERGIK